VVQEQVVSSYAQAHETRKADNNCLMEKLKIVPDKLSIEAIYVVDYPIEELKSELDKHVIEDQHVKENSVTSLNLLHCGTVTEDNNADIAFKSERLRKAPIFMVIPKSVNPGNVSKLQIFSQNIMGLGTKIDELIVNSVNYVPHILCLSEVNLSMKIIQTTSIDNYNLGAYLQEIC
jgi:hypothetical protein